MTVFLIDISNHQRGFDLAKAKDAGVAAVIAKASEGRTYRDPTYAGFRDQAHRLNLPFVAYHFLHAGNAAEQVKNLATAISFDRRTPVMIDCEPTTGSRPTVIDCIHFKRECQLRGLRVIWNYFPRWYWIQIGKPDLSKVGLPLVQSSYVSGSDTPQRLYSKVPQSWWTGFGGAEIQLLQFSSQCQVAGFRVDINAFRGTKEELTRIITPATRIQPKTATTKPQEVKEMWVITREVGPGENVYVAVPQSRQSASVRFFVDGFQDPNQVPLLGFQLGTEWVDGLFWDVGENRYLTELSLARMYEFYSALRPDTMAIRILNQATDSPPVTVSIVGT
jgi:hypothetical protein